MLSIYNLYKIYDTNAYYLYDKKVIGENKENKGSWYHLYKPNICFKVFLTLSKIIGGNICPHLNV